jgi:2-C-methyl-D-erythritol 4-phosphate cytidylyltransferase
MDLILLSAGKGSRAKLNCPKQLMRLGGKPILIIVLETFRKIKEIDNIVVTVPENLKYYRELIDDYNLKNIQCIKGGKTRQESVYLGLLECDSEQVIIHESARPFVTCELIEKLINEFSDNVVPVFPCKSTMVNIEKETTYLNRDSTFEVQLPQKFNYNELFMCHNLANIDNKKFTDDSSLFFYYSKEEIEFIDGIEENMKITTAFDVEIAKRSDFYEK